VQAGKRFSVVYLLHQYSFWAASWHSPGSGQPNPEANKAVDSVSGIICVAPDDGLAGKSWWIDSPAKADAQLSTFLTTELKDTIDKQYATYTDRAHTGICGVSMGGYGTLHNLLIHSEVYSAGFSVVGCVDLNKWKGSFDIPTVLPTYNASYDILPNAASYKSKNVKIRFYTTDGDFFKDDNIAFDKALTTAAVTHQYELLSGTHEMPTPERMVMILRWFQLSFYGTTVSGPGAMTRSAKQPASAKYRTYVQMSKGWVSKPSSAMTGKGVDGRLRASPTAVLIK